MSRIAIVGGPRTGKTTISMKLGISPVRHTDDLIGKLDWSAASDEVARWLDEPGPWVIEGVAVVRALRKWLVARPVGKPCDRVIQLWVPRVPLSLGQERMTTGCLTIWREIRSELWQRGVAIEVGGHE